MGFKDYTYIKKLMNVIPGAGIIFLFFFLLLFPKF